MFANPSVQEGTSRFLPLLLHGDAGSFQRYDSLMVLSMRSLLSDANVSRSQLLIAVMPKSAMSKSEVKEKDTMEQLWSIVTWSLTHLFHGKHPEKDHLGRAWPDRSPRSRTAGTPLHSQGLCGMIFSITGDGDFYQNELRLPGSSHFQCCFSCLANKGGTPHNDYRPGALWRGTLRDHKNSCPTDHPLAGVPGINGYTFHYDVLHILEEGVSSQACANCLFDWIIRKEIPGSTQEERLKEVYKRLQVQYEEQAIDSSNRIKHLKMSSFCNPAEKYKSFPELSGFKARQIRYMVPCFLDICKQTLREDRPYTRHRLLCLQNLESMYTIMEESGMHLSAKASKKFQQVTDLCMLHFAKCSKLTIQDKLLMWNTIHKCHLTCHLPSQAAYLNPRFVSTYHGETMVGYMAALGHSCLNGTPGHMVPARVAWRFRLGMHLRSMGHGLDAETEFED